MPLLRLSKKPPQSYQKGRADGKKTKKQGEEEVVSKSLPCPLLPGECALYNGASKRAGAGASQEWLEQRPRRPPWRLQWEPLLPPEKKYRP
nr:unnamed protein product [Digitaria exilis]